MFARSEGSLRPRSQQTNPSTAAKPRRERDQRSPSIKGFSSLRRHSRRKNLTAPGRNLRRQKTPGAPIGAVKNLAPQAARPLLPFAKRQKATSENLESVPAFLRRHASRVHLSCIHMGSRVSASANGNFHFSTEQATPISTPQTTSQSETSPSQTRWSCRFFVPASYSPSAPDRPSPGQLQNRLPAKVPS